MPKLKILRASVKQLSVLALMFAMPCLVTLAKEPLPQVSPEGLQLQDSKDARVVYRAPGADFAKYRKVAILDTYVEFSKDWQRNYNSSATGVAGRVSDADVQRMKTAVAAEFKKVFTQVLASDQGYEVVDAAAPDVLVLRPAIINLQVNAPDLRTASMITTVVRSAGQMTLYLELWDSSTNTILARIMDSQADDGFATIANRASNKAAADEILRYWAKKLRKNLDASRQATPGQP